MRLHRLLRGALGRWRHRCRPERARDRRCRRAPHGMAELRMLKQWSPGACALTQAEAAWRD
eukprot:10855108-Alexandrium_andersonii.AAC.1